MARKYPGSQHDTAEAMGHSVGTAQRNYHSLGLKNIQKARLTKAVSDTLSAALAQPEDTSSRCGTAGQSANVRRRRRMHFNDDETGMVISLFDNYLCIKTVPTIRFVREIVSKCPANSALTNRSAKQIVDKIRTLIKQSH